VYVIELNLLRSEVDNASPLVLQLFVFSTLRYSQIDLMEQKSQMEILINKLFNWLLRLRHSTILVVERIDFKRNIGMKNDKESCLF